jgi:hypothetical protein
LDDVGVFTPYSTAKQLMSESDLGMWTPELDQERIASYLLYDRMYWSDKDTFIKLQRGEEEAPLYVPGAMQVVDNTAHFWMKGLTITSSTEQGQTLLDPFLKREMFLPKFMTGKHSGVCRGDFLLHVTADPGKPEGSRISVNTIDPAMYFPEYDDDDLERILAVNLVEHVLDENDPDPKLRIQRYSYTSDGADRRVQVEIFVAKPDKWYDRDKRRVVRVEMNAKLLPLPIRTIPVYHWKNMDWQGDPFGSSELRGFERLLAGINQSASDEDLALALAGLGVFVTDSGTPDSGQWEISPGHVVEVGGRYFKRVEGLDSVDPFQAHLKYLHDQLNEAGAVFRGSTIDATVAESGIALAIRFLPKAAKLEQRDLSGVGRLEQFWFDWKFWLQAYENTKWPSDSEILVKLGDKLPTNKSDLLNVWNNMVDRQAIPKSLYRERVAEIYGITLPDNIDDELAKEADAAFERQQKLASLRQPDQNLGENNKNKRNESNGTEAD